MGCASLESADVPDSLEKLGEGAFYNCRSLSEISLGASDIIPDMAFKNCTSLKKVIGGAPKTIGSYAFDGCRSLAECSIPDSVQSLGDGAFKNCVSIKSVKIGNSLTKVGEYCFKNISADITFGDSPSMEKIYTRMFECTQEVFS